MSDIPPRRAMTEYERATLSNVEEISRALSEPANVSHVRSPEPQPPSPEHIARLKAAANVMERSEIALRDPGIKTRNEMFELMIGFCIAEIWKLETKLAKIEARPELKYVGTWRDGHAYREGNFVTHAGGIWYCHSATMARPGSNSDWQLSVKSAEERRTARSGR